MRKCIVTAASDMSAENFALICEKLKAKTGNDVEIVRVSDDSIIGGFILNIDGMIYDMSISAQLAEMRKHMKEE